MSGGPVTDPRAYRLRERYHAHFGGAELPVPVERIAEDLLGLAVAERDDLAVSGMLLPAEREIYVNAEDVPTRRRFTLAHEVGHWVCQCLEGKGAPVMCRAEDVSEGADRTLEREANVFAAELLMPEPAVRAEFSGGGEIAERFGVSSEAMAWRLYNLGLVEESPAAQLERGDS
jgi:Zn-dependent peptidase ImmA (M78 family)